MDMARNEHYKTNLTRI